MMNKNLEDIENKKLHLFVTGMCTVAEIKKFYKGAYHVYYDQSQARGYYLM